MTADERALLAAVAVDPDADLPRLVYADWLDDHDRPERAEVVRAAVELGRAPWASPLAERSRQLNDRMHELFTAELAWASELRAGLPAGPQTSFWSVGGVPLGLECTAKYLADHAARIANRLPVVGLRLRRPAAKWVAPHACGPVWPRLHRLAIETDQLDTRTLTALLAALPERLADLAVTGAFGYSTADGTPAGWLDRSADKVAALAATPAMARLWRLDLSDAGIGDAGAAALARSPFLDGLRVLHVSGNHLSNAARRQLCDRFGHRVLFERGPADGPMTYGELYG